MKTLHSTGLKTEVEHEYSRAVSVNDTLYVSATAPVDEQMQIRGEDAYGQTNYVLTKLKPVFAEAGYDLSDVVQVRAYMPVFEDFTLVTRALREQLNGARPTLSIVHVQPFPLPRLRLELELTAVREHQGDARP